jgi:hypothetical protein
VNVVSFVRHAQASLCVEIYVFLLPQKRWKPRRLAVATVLVLNHVNIFFAEVVVLDLVTASPQTESIDFCDFCACSDGSIGREPTEHTIKRTQCEESMLVSNTDDGFLRAPSLFFEKSEALHARHPLKLAARCVGMTDGRDLYARVRFFFNRPPLCGTWAVACQKA